MLRELQKCFTIITPLNTVLTQTLLWYLLLHMDYVDYRKKWQQTHSHFHCSFIGGFSQKHDLKAPATELKPKLSPADGVAFRTQLSNIFLFLFLLKKNIQIIPSVAHWGFRIRQAFPNLSTIYSFPQVLSSGWVIIFLNEQYPRSDSVLGYL